MCDLRRRPFNWVVRRLLVCVLGVTWLIDAASAAPTADAAAVTAGNPQLDFTLAAQRGGNFRLAEQRGRVVWLALVAPWCGQCAGFVGEVAKRLRAVEPESSVAAPAVFMVVSAVDARGNALDVPIDVPPQVTTGPAGAGASSIKLLIDRDGAVLRTFDPDELPWLVRIDEDGALVAAGADLDVLAPARIEPGLWQNLRSRWRQVWGEQEP